MATPIDFIILLVMSFALNLVPFAGPSNMIIASTAAIGIGNASPLTILFIGGMVALGSTLAKSTHYMVTFFISGKLAEKRRQKIAADAAKIKRWAFFLLFIAAATPIPDEPVVISLGLMKYKPAKFFVAYFLGKFSIGIMGAIMGKFAVESIGKFISPEIMIAISIILTIILTIILLKVDIGKLVEKYLPRKPKTEQEKN
ncbi:MAG: VTT domain-containing protein [Nitrososphaerota archaeon]|jgi:membrane protein YqaA with SNARE-associated domain|nr:VTT domain-containing protein [Nitrososphaerota archaeon]